MTYIEISQFLWSWALQQGFSAEVVQEASRVSDTPFQGRFGFVVLVADEQGALRTYDQTGVDSSG